jgi:quercetin dioxygenase-like cupin family protein
MSPSIASLKKICDAMDVPIGYLFDNGDSPGATPTVKVLRQNMESYMKIFPPTNQDGTSPVVRKEKRKIMIPAEGVRYYLLNPNLFGPIEMIYNELEPGATTGPIPYTHPGSECGFVLSGEITVLISKNKYVLQEGDSISFPSSEPHYLSNNSDTLSTCVWVNVPPWF